METPVERHYTQGDLLSRIEAGVRALGKTRATVSVEDLGPVDEFHIGGRPATESLLSQLHLRSGMQVLDVGCGLGGTARLACEHYGCRVSGIDLTSEFIDVARVLSEWVGLAGRLDFCCGTALEMPFDAGSFDAAFQLHVGMNIADKRALFSEIHRVLRPGALFGVYDVMKTGEGSLTFPVPWATHAEDSAVAAPGEYAEALRASGFELVTQRDRREVALDFFRQMRIRASAEAPALGVHLVMGDRAAAKRANVIAHLEEGVVSPVEIIARRC